MTDRTPRTEAGRAYIARKHRPEPTSDVGRAFRDADLIAVLAIEAEAHAAGLREVLALREAVRAFVAFRDEWDARWRDMSRPFTMAEAAEHDRLSTGHVERLRALATEGEPPECWACHHAAHGPGTTGSGCPDCFCTQTDGPRSCMGCGKSTTEFATGSLNHPEVGLCARCVAAIRATEGEPQRPQFPTATTLTVDEVEVAPVTEGEPPAPEPGLREAVGRIAAWSVNYRSESRTQLRSTMKLIHDEAMAAYPTALDAAPRALATEGKPQRHEHRPEYQRGAREHALREALAEFVVADPWQRATPGEGLVTTDEPWECVGCHAEVPFPEQDSSQPGWWENDGHPDPDDLTPHTALCRWVRGRRALATEGEPHGG